MRATVMYAAGDVRVEDVPDAAIVEPTDAILRVTRACICGSDLHPYHQMERSETGRPMGHEAIGVVEDVGAGVRSIKHGDLVVMPFAFSDGTCAFCREGLHTACVHGGFSTATAPVQPRLRPCVSRTPTARCTRCRSARTTRSCRRC
jgi:threonine dehydrogenase-like Zn-dependent dehydrogenase